MDNEQPYIFFEEQKKVNHVHQNPTSTTSIKVSNSQKEKRNPHILFLLYRVHAYWTGHSVVSVLSIKSAIIEDTGNYSCILPVTGESATVTLNILKGGHVFCLELILKIYCQRMFVDGMGLVLDLIFSNRLPSVLKFSFSLDFVLLSVNLAFPWLREICIPNLNILSFLPKVFGWSLIVIL